VLGLGVFLVVAFCGELTGFWSGVMTGSRGWPGGGLGWCVGSAGWGGGQGSIGLGRDCSRCLGDSLCRWVFQPLAGLGQGLV